MVSGVLVIDLVSREFGFTLQVIAYVISWSGLLCTLKIASFLDVGCWNQSQHFILEGMRYTTGQHIQSPKLLTLIILFIGKND